MQGILCKEGPKACTHLGRFSSIRSRADSSHALQEKWYEPHCSCTLRQRHWDDGPSLGAYSQTSGRMKSWPHFMHVRFHYTAKQCSHAQPNPACPDNTQPSSDTVYIASIWKAMWHRSFGLNSARRQGALLEAIERLGDPPGIRDVHNIRWDVIDCNTCLAAIIENCSTMVHSMQVPGSGWQGRTTNNQTPRFAFAFFYLNGKQLQYCSPEGPQAESDLTPDLTHRNCRPQAR